MNQSRRSAVQPRVASARVPATPNFRIALVSSNWHADIVEQATSAAKREFKRRRIRARDIQHFKVPGAFEIPLHAKRLAASGAFDAIVAFGLVVDGGIYRHDFVAAAVIEGLMRVQLDTDVPVFSAVLTPQAFHEHATHRQFFAEHLVAKGVEAAQACVVALTSLHTLPPPAAPTPLAS